MLSWMNEVNEPKYMGSKWKELRPLQQQMLFWKLSSWDIFSFEVFFGYFQNNVVKIKLIISNE